MLLLCDLGQGPSPASVSPPIVVGGVSPLTTCHPIQPWGVEGQLWMRAEVRVPLGS